MRCLTVLGPSQSGKSTLVKALGRLEGGSQGTAFSDRLAVRSFSYLGEDWAALDITGGTENLGTAGHALAASDAVILCVSPDPEEASLSAPYLRLIEDAEVPCYLFINRMDAAHGRMRDTVASLQTYASHPIVLRQIPMRVEGQVVGSVDLISERAWAYQDGAPSHLIALPPAMEATEQEARADLLEHLADFDDALLEQLIEDNVPAPENLFALVSQIHQSNSVIPAYMGAAAQGNGVFRLMKSLRHECNDAGDVAQRLGVEAKAIAVLADHRKHVGRSVLLRDLSGGLRQGDKLGGVPIGALGRFGGAPTPEPSRGALAVAVKSDHLLPGHGYCEDEAWSLPGWIHGLPPGYARVIAPVNDRDDARLSAALSKLAATDPGLVLGHDEDTGQIIVRLQGAMHLRRVREKLDEDFDLSIHEFPVRGQYRETISKSVELQYRHRKQSGGAGQFADIVFHLQPQPLGAGFRFAERVKGGSVPRNYIPSVEAGTREALQSGPLGFPVLDVAVTLLDGKHHSVDSSDYAFKTAALLGMREALRKAGPVLLQPIEHVEIHVPSLYTGQLVALISSLKGQVLGFDPHPTAKGWDIFRSVVPSASLEGLHQSLGGLTHGTAWAEWRFDHYEELHGKQADRVKAERSELA